VKPRPLPELQTTTLWDFPSQNYGSGRQGDPDYAGATPSYVVWNLLKRYTAKKDLVLDPMCGSGTTIDVARDLERRAQGFDLQPSRRDVHRADARRLPVPAATADFVFVDPPYSTHVQYSGLPECIGTLDAFTPAYFEAMGQVVAELHRVLKPDRYCALYVGDTYEHGRGFVPIGLKLFALLCERFTPVEQIAVVRHNRSLENAAHHRAAREGNFFLRGFHHLFVMAKGTPADRRADEDRR
jgi:SAM-dependent methyltransferase